MTQAHRKNIQFRDKFGPWAVVAGGSEGIGRAFARSLAAREINLLLIARKKMPLEALGRELEAEFHIGTIPLALDLADSGSLSRVVKAAADLDAGLLVYNAALADTGPFLSRQEETLQRIVDTNCTAPLFLCRHIGETMARRGKGGIILLSSMSGFQGTPYVAAYGATKAFNLVLAEGLWYEFKGKGVDVLACCPGPTDTPGFNASLKGKKPPAFPPVLDPQQVAEESLRSLGRRSVLVPAMLNRLSSFFIQKLLPRQAGVKIMGNSTGRLYGQRNF